MSDRTIGMDVAGQGGDKSVEACYVLKEVADQQIAAAVAAFRNDVLDVLSGMDGMLEARAQIATMPTDDSALQAALDQRALEEALWWDEQPVFASGARKAREQRIAALRAKVGR